MKIIYQILQKRLKSRYITCLTKNKNGLKSIVEARFWAVFQDFLIVNMNIQLTSLNSIYSTLITLNDDINQLNESISQHRETLSNYLTERLQIYYTDIENSKNQSLIHSDNIKKLEEENIELTVKIQIYLQINIAQNELLNTVTDEYALYFGMWNWYGYVFLPSIKTITIEDLPNVMKFYNTNTLEYPTK